MRSVEGDTVWWVVPGGRGVEVLTAPSEFLPQSDWIGPFDYWEDAQAEANHEMRRLKSPKPNHSNVRDFPSPLHQGRYFWQPTED